LLRNNALVHGNALTEGTVSFQSGAAILGARIENTELDPIQHQGWTVNFPSMNQGPLNLEPGQLRTISAGNFAGGNLKTGSILTLSTPGRYTLNGSLTLEPGSTLDVDNTQGAVEVYVRNGFTFRGTITPRNPSTANVLVGVGGTTPVPVEAPWKGILVAPHAAVTLATASAGHRGSVYAKSILVGPNTIFTHDPLDPTNFCEPQAACDGLCQCPPGSACDQGGDCSGGAECCDGVCGGPSCGCTSSGQCATGFFCDAGTCAPCHNPNEPGCTPDHCSNGVRDQGETDVDCGGTCPGCDPGGICDLNSDCGAGLACFGGSCADCTSNPDAIECQAPEHCSNGTKDADETDIDCGGSCPPCDPGQSCNSNDDCTSGDACIAGTCADCDSNPGAPECETPSHCSNGSKDFDETGVDCGGSCPGCATGGGCHSNTDCATGFVCGANNGACIGEGRARADRACWPASCEDEVLEPGECGEASSPCGQNCSCANSCNADDPTPACPNGETCERGLGTLYNLVARDACIPIGCPSNNPALCGGPFKLCGEHCVREPDCSTATCADPDDGANGICAVCDPGDECTTDLQCKAGYACLESGSSILRCLPVGCRLARLVPPLCGSATAPCGAQCPACSPQCDGRECGPDPNCGQPCGTCATGALCDANGQCNTPTEDPEPTVPDGNGGQTPVVDLPPPSTSGVGALRGGFTVSEQGTPEYTVPIDVPPGRAGMEPDLSLRYSGSRASGDLGVGWHIQGLSRITRCPKVRALEGYAAPVANDQSDPLCLDGKRLRSVGGNEYRTIVDSFAKIVSFVEDGAGVQRDPVSGIPRKARNLQGADYFKVWTKDGRIMTFGGNLDALVLGPDGVRRAWLLSRIEDRVGNTILYTYENVGGQHGSSVGGALPTEVRPSVISYTGYGGQAGNREVRFTYEERTDPTLRFLQAGVATFSTERLVGISTFVKGEPAKDYKLAYRNQNASQIEEIFECAGGGGPCKAPTHFDYVAESGFEEGMSPPSFDVFEGAQLDANGDGVPDYLSTTTTVDGIRAQPELIAAQLGADAAMFVLTTFIITAPEFGIPIAFTYAIWKPLFWGLFADKPEIVTTNGLVLGTADRQTRMSQHTASGLPCGPGHPTFLLDYDRDGRDDVASICEDRLIHSTYDTAGRFTVRSTLADPLVMFPGWRRVLPTDSYLGPAPTLYDIDGDGLQDILSCTNEFTMELRRRISATQGFIQTPLVVQAPTFPPSKLPSETQTFCRSSRPTHNIIDIDGDGTPDLLLRDEDGWKVLRYSRISGVEKLEWQPVYMTDWNKSDQGQGLTLGDYNGDGLVDMFSASGTDARIWLNTGHRSFVGQVVERPIIAPTGFSARRRAAFDYDADGRTDLLEGWSGSSPFPFNVSLSPTGDASALIPQEAADIVALTGFGQVLPHRFHMAGDIDGDGNPDLIGERGVNYGSGSRNMLLSKVTDGLGNVVTVKYEQVASDGTPTYLANCTGELWPETCLKRMSSLVSSHADELVAANGSPLGERKYEYHYQNARFSVTGHGWLGFERRTIRETVANKLVRTVITEYEAPARFNLEAEQVTSSPPPAPFVYPLAGKPRKVIVDQPIREADEAPSPLETVKYERRTRIDNTWAVGRSLTSFGDGLPFPKLDSRVTASSERELASPPLPESENGVHRTGCTETFVTDGYGNVPQHHQICGLERRHTISTFQPNQDDWLISNPELITIQSFRDEIDDSETQTWDPDYYANGLLHTITRAPNQSERRIAEYIRDEFGNPLQVIESVATGEAARTTTVTYDADGVFPLTITNALGHTTQVRFDERWGKPITLVDPNGVAVQHAYDGLELLGETRDSTGITLFGYESVTPSPIPPPGEEAPLGRTRVTISREGTNGTRTGTIVTDLDHYGRVIRRKTVGFEGAEVVQTYSFDVRNRLAGASFPSLAEASTPAAFTSYKYDGLDRLTRIEHADGSFAERHYASRVTLASQHQAWLEDLNCGEEESCAVDVALSIDEEQDEEQKKNVVITDHFGLVLRNVDGDNVDATQHFTTHRYGPFNRIGEIADNGNVVSAIEFKHDPYGNLLEHEDPDVGVATNTYNGFDELKTSRDPKQQLRTLNYDDIGRLTSIVDPAGTSQWIYDQGVNAIGRISETISPGTTEYPSGQRVVYTYEPVIANNRGLVQRFDYVIDGADYPIALAYDDLGRTDRVDYPNVDGGTPVSAKYTYDDAGILTGLDEVGSGATNPIWHMTEAFQGHLIQKETFGSRASTSYAYDPARRWIDTIQTEVDSDPVQALEYTRYKNAQVHFRNSIQASREYLYDQMNRLSTTKETPSGGATITTAYGYDLLGNMTQRGATTITHLSNKPHLIDNVGNNGYQYDANGNVSQRSGPDIPGGIQTFTYTPFNLPRSIVTGQSGVARTTRFEYSPDEERLVRRDSDLTRHFATDLYQRVVENQGGATREETFRFYAGAREIAQIVREDGSDKTLFFHTDHLGSIDTISTSSGSVIRQDFDPFGTPVDPPDPEVTRVGYTGHQHDRDLEMIDMRGRMYDPLAARFVSADPFMQAPSWSQGLNRYAYVFNDPVNNVDPSGFFGDAAGSGGGGLMGGLFLGGMANAGYQALSIGGFGALGAAGIGLASLAATPGVGIGFGSPGSQTQRGALGAAAPTSTGATQGGMNATGQNIPLSAPTRPSLFDPEAGALACNSGGDVCLEILRRQQEEQRIKNIQAVEEMEWELFWAYTGSSAIKWSVRGFQMWRAARAAAAAARGVPTLAQALSGLGKTDARILGRAAEIARGGGRSFANDLAALSRATAEAVPGGKVHVIGELGGRQIFGSAVSRTGIVTSAEGTLVVRAPAGGSAEVLGLFY